MSTESSCPNSSFVSDALRIGAAAFFRHSFGLIAIAAILITVVYLSAGRLGSSFKQVIERKVNQHLAGTGIRVAFSDIQFVENEGIRVDDLEVFLSDAADVHHSAKRFLPAANTTASATVPPNQNVASSSNLAVRNLRPYFPALSRTPATPHFTVKHLWLRGRLNPATFVSGKFAPQTIELISPAAHLSLDAQGKLQLPAFRLPKPVAAPPSAIRLSNGMVTLNCAQTANNQWQVVIPQLEVLRNAEWTNTESTVEKVTWQLNGTTNVLGLPDVRVQGTLVDNQFQISASGKPTHVHSRLWQEIRPWIPQKFRSLEGISGWIDLKQFQLEGHLADAENSQPSITRFLLEGRVDEVQFQDGRLPQPVLNVSGDFSADQNGLVFRNLRGNIGDGSLQLDGRLTDWKTLTFQSRLVAHRLRFNKRWVPLLPEKQQNEWLKFQPEGLVSCDVQIHRDATGQVTKTGTIDVDEMNYVFEDFPVPIQGAAGRFQLEGKNCQFHLQVSNELYPMDIQGYANNIGPDWTGMIKLRSTAFHPFDQSLYQGLAKKPEAVRVIREINPTGQMAFNGFIHKGVPQEKADVRFNVRFTEGIVQHVRFPYRVSGIEGQLRYENGNIFADHLVGVSSTGNIKAVGRFQPGQDWHVRLVGHAVELNTELYQALSPAQRELWDNLHPRGVLDEVVVDLFDQEGECKIRVATSQQPSTPSDPSYLSFKADWFPYQVDGLSGKLLYENDQVILTGIRGTHGTVSVAFDGAGHINRDGWKVTIYNLLTGQIPIGRDIKAALPETVRTATEQLAMAGSVSVQGSVTVSNEIPSNLQRLGNRTQPGVHRLAPDQGTRVLRMQDTGVFAVDNNLLAIQSGGSNLSGSETNLTWDLRLDMEDAALQVGLPAKHVHGMVQLTGESSSREAYCRGNLNIDSAIVEGMQVTRIQGPIGMNEREITFGTQVPAASLKNGQQPIPVSSVTMESMGGRIELDGRVLLIDDMPFSLRTTVDHLDLREMARTFAPETNDIAGSGFGSLTLQGNSGGTHTLNGRGKVEIQKARLYEVPLFLQLLKVLQVRKPDNTAFDEGSIEFKITGEDIQLNRIELNGDAISLLGRGQANLNQEISLDFYTVLGRNKIYMPVISDLLHISSQQLLWITVEGTIANPKITHETGRAINEALRLFVDDMEAASKLAQ